MGLGLLLRGSENGFYCAWFDGGRRFGIGKSVAKRCVPLIMGDSPQPYDDYFDFEFSAVGDTLTLSVNGQPLLITHDSSHIAGSVSVGGVGSGLFRDVEILIPNKESLVADNRKPLPPPEPNVKILEKGAATAGAHKTVDLLTLVDLSKDVIRGNWWKFGDGSVACEPSNAALLEIPYSPPHEYDYRIVFVVSSLANQPVALACCGGGTQFSFVIGGWGNTISGFSMINGRGANINPTGVRANHWIVSGQRHVSVVKVRKDGVEGWFDGVLVASHKTDWADMSPGYDRLRRPDSIGLCVSTGACIESAKIIEITGEGKVLRDGSDLGSALRTDFSPAAGSEPPPPAVAPFDAPHAKAHQAAWAKYLGVPVEVTNSIGMKLALIPPGEFDMGSPQELIDAEFEATPKDDKWYLDHLPGEGPRHHVRITRPFYLGMYPVTQEEYQKVMRASPSWFSATGKGKDAVGGHDTERFPVETVSWTDADEFCSRLSEMAEEKSAGRRYRLPSEAQWEYACRAGSTGR